MNKTLIVYDHDGEVILNISGNYRIPNGLPYLEIKVPDGKYVVSVNVETKEPIYEDIPKSQTEILEDKISILNEQNSKLLLDKAKNEIQINTLNKNLANITLEVDKMKGGM
ncbi:hypothetical protein [Faecalimicrobium sp. JNUCC 81]